MFHPSIIAANHFVENGQLSTSIAPEDEALFLDDDMEEEEGGSRYAGGSTSASAASESNGNWLRFMEYGDSAVQHPSNSSSSRKVSQVRQLLNRGEVGSGTGLGSSTTHSTQGTSNDRNAMEEDASEHDDHQEDEEVGEESTTLSKVDRIEQSFHHFTPVHRDKPDLVAECVWEVLPDELNCCFDFGLVVG